MARKNATKFNRRILSKNSSQTIGDLLREKLANHKTNFQVKGNLSKQVFLETAKEVREEQKAERKQKIESEKQIRKDAKTERLNFLELTIN